MASILVAGITNLETSLAIEGFPVGYAKSRFAFNGVTDRLGGVGYNVAAELGGLGASVELATMLGHDVVGDVLERELLRIPNLEPGSILRRHDRSLRSVILVGPDGEGAMNTDLKDSQEIAYPERELRDALMRAHWLHATNINWALAFAERARALGIPVSTDVQNLQRADGDPYNDRFLALADLVFLSGENLQASIDSTIGTIFDRFPARIVVVTRGSEGALFAERQGQLQHQPAPSLPRAPINATGAGDAFAAGFLAFWTRQEDLHQAVAAGQRNAARWICGP